MRWGMRVYKYSIGMRNKKISALIEERNGGGFGMRRIRERVWGGGGWRWRLEQNILIFYRQYFFYGGSITRLFITYESNSILSRI